MDPKKKKEVEEAERKGEGREIEKGGRWRRERGNLKIQSKLVYSN